MGACLAVALELIKLFRIMLKMVFEKIKPNLHDQRRDMDGTSSDLSGSQFAFVRKELADVDRHLRDTRDKIDIMTDVLKEMLHNSREQTKALDRQIDTLSEMRDMLRDQAATKYRLHHETLRQHVGG